MISSNTVPCLIIFKIDSGLLNRTLSMFNYAEFIRMIAVTLYGSEKIVAEYSWKQCEKRYKINLKQYETVYSFMVEFRQRNLAL